MIPIQTHPLNLDNPVTARRGVQDPDLSTLNDGQQEATEIFINFSKDPNANYFILEGWAGTGKTYLSSMIIEWLLFNSIQGTEVAMTAPVNDAVKVLKNSARFQDDRLHYGTIHSLAGMKAQRNKNGELKFKKDYHKPCLLDDCNYLVIDEGSMLHSELFHIIHDNYVTLGKLKVIIIGDGGQIPPVGEKSAIPFTKEGRNEYNMWFYELTQIVRQAEGSPIINFTARLRKKIHAPKPILNCTSNTINNTGLLFLGSDNRPILGKLIKDLFTSEDFAKNPNYAKVICWRNVVVAQFNKLIRGMIFGKGLTKVMVGEKMVASDAITDGYDTFIMSNGTKFEVLSFEIDKIFPIGGSQYKFYKSTVIFEGNEGMETKKIRIIHEDSEQIFKDDLQKIAKVAKEEPDGNIRMKLWNKYWALKGFFAAVSYNYAITAHRSQGSTYQYALVIMEDIYGGNHPKVTDYDRNRLGYTACTRPKDLLVMVGDL